MALRTITAPGVEHVSVPVLSGQTLAFTFDASNAFYERTDDNLTINFDNGGKVTLDGFFRVEEGGALPALRLEDGAEVSAKDFLAAMNPDMDLATAAGPGASPSSSGAGDYADGAGDLIGGVERLGSLGTDQWSGGQTASASVLAAGDATGGPGTGGGETPGTGGGEMPGGDGPYHTRLIVTDTAANTFSFFAVDKNGNLVDDASKISYAFDGGASRYFTVLGIDPATGRISVELTQAGLDALAAGEHVGDMLLISVDGEEYRMPLVINDDQSYNHVSEETQANLGPDLKAEWYASDSSTVGDENIKLGGSNYNRVDIDKSSTGFSYATANTKIDVTASEKSDVNITAASETANAYGMAALDGDASVVGGSRSTITIKATTDGLNKVAYGVATQKGNTHIEGNDIRIEAGNSTEGSAYGIYGTQYNGGTSVTNVHAASDLTIIAHGEEANRDPFAQVSGAMADYRAAINLKVDHGGKLVVESTLAQTDQYTYDLANNGSFQVTGLAARAGGKVAVQASDIDVSAKVDEQSTHGTASAVYSGWADQSQISEVTIKGHEDVNNTMTFSAKARDIANGILATNSGNVYVTGGNRDDVITVNAEAERGSAIGLFAQANNGLGGSKVHVDGGDGDDTLNINTRFTGTPNGGDLELTGAPRGAIGIIAAWQQGWGNDEHGASQVRIDNIENINIHSDATGSTGSAIGIYTRSAYQTAPGVYINSNGKALTLTVTAVADDPSRAYAIYNNGGTVEIKGGSTAGGPGDSITLNGHVDIMTNTGQNRILTGSGDDTVTVNGDVRATLNAAHNLIDTGSGNNTVTITGNLAANNPDARNTIRAGDGDDSVTIGGSMTGSGKNSIEVGGGDNTVSIGWSMLAQGSNAANSITSGSGTDSISVTGQVYASDGGKNVIDTGLNDPGKAHDTLTVNYGTVAHGNNSHNSLTSDVININNRNGHGISTSVGSTDTGAAETYVTARQTLTIDASNSAGNADGIFSQGDANTKNIIKAGTGIDIDVATTGSWGQASGVYANWSSTAEVTTETGDIDIDVFSENSDAWGVNGNNNVSLKAEGEGGKILISADGGTNAHGVWSGNYSADKLVSINAFAQTGTALGVKSSTHSNTSISAEKVDIRVVAEAGSHDSNGMFDMGDIRAMGIFTHSDARTYITGKDISVSATTENFGDAVGMLTQMPNSRDKITSTTLEADKVYVEAITNNTDTATTGNNATAMQALGNQYQQVKGSAANIIKAGTGGAEIVAKSGWGTATGMYATDLGARNMIESEGNITVTATHTDGGNVWQSRGLDAVNSGENILKATGDVTITSESYYDALGMYAGGKYDNVFDQASNTVDAKGDITVNTTNGTGTETSVAYGVYAENGKNTLASQEGDIRIQSRGTGDVRGVLSHDSGLNTLTALGGLVDISATGGVFGRGVDAWGSDNKITAKKVNITSVMSKDSIGVAASYSGENTIDSATDIAVTSTITGDEAGSSNSGLWALDNGKNVLTAVGNVTITAEHGDTVNGVRGEGGINDIAGKVVTITANGSNTDTTYGMFASQGGENNVHALDGHGIHVTITAKAGTMDEAIALFADGAKNIISGDLSGDYADNITINGGMQAVNEGTNLIRTGGGNDHVTINGTIDASGNTQPGTGNIIDTGDGDDVIRLHGGILGDDALSLNAGDGYDTLVLVADDFAQFQQFYGSWLAGNFSGMNVEAVHVDLNGVSDADWINFQSYFNSFPNDVSITYTVDGTLYADGYLNAQGGSVLDLGSILDTLDDNDIKELDLTGGDANLVHIGREALDSLAQDELLIRGDGNDSVTLFGSSGDWQSSAWDQDSNYTCYSNGDGQQIIVQNDILVGFGG